MEKIINKVKQNRIYIYCICIIRNFPLTIWLHRFFSFVYLDILVGVVFFPFAFVFFLFMRVRYFLIKPKYSLAIVMIIKNEANYIKELIDYYKIIGADKFYVFDNDSEDDVYNVVRNYVDDKFVIYKKLSGKKRQKDVYNIFLNKYGYLFKYAAYFDADEFLKTQNKDCLVDIDAKFQEYNHLNIGALGINWIVFGTNGHQKQPKGAVIQNYTKSTEYDFYLNHNLKFISKPSATLSIRVPHFPYLIGKKRYVTSYGVVVECGYCDPTPSGGGMFLYHYYTKSKEEYFKRIYKGCVFSGHSQKRIEDVEFIDSMCINNYTLFDFMGYKR